MDKKIKLVIIGLFLIAGFAVTRIAIVLDKYLEPARATIQQEKLQEAFGNDVDKDGIADNDEAFYQTDPLDPDSDGDGFLDGEEVAAGCDPLIKSPGDCKNSKTLALDENQNLTEELADLIVSGIYSGDLKPQSKNFNKSLDLLGSVFTDISFSESEAKNLTINNNPTQADNKNYLNSMNEIFKIKFMEPIVKRPLTSTEAANLFEVNSNNEAARYYSSVFRETRLALEQLKTTSDFLEIHKELIEIFQGYELSYGALVNTSDDPVKTVITMNKMSLLAISYREEINKLIQKIKQEDIQLKDNIFNLIINI